MADPLFSVNFELLDRSTTNIKSYSLESSFNTSTDAFKFDLYERDLDLRLNLELQPVKLSIDGAVQMVGRVDTTRMGERGHAVSVSGRDYMADLVECCVDPSLSLKSEQTLEAAILAAAGPAGITKVVGGTSKFRNIRTGYNNQTSTDDPTFLEIKLQDFKPKPGQGIYQFLKDIGVLNHAFGHVAEWSAEQHHQRDSYAGLQQVPHVRARQRQDVNRRRHAARAHLRRQ
jgi:hypothetical protein